METAGKRITQSRRFSPLFVIHIQLLKNCSDNPRKTLRFSILPTDKKGVGRILFAYRESVSDVQRICLAGGKS